VGLNAVGYSVAYAWCPSSTLVQPVHRSLLCGQFGAAERSIDANQPFSRRMRSSREFL